MKPADYKWIARWGEMLGIDKWTIDYHQRLAARTNAPLTVVYPLNSGRERWNTIDGLLNRRTRAHMQERYDDCPAWKEN